MRRISFTDSDNPDGLIALVNALPGDFVDTHYSVVFPSPNGAVK